MKEKLKNKKTSKKDLQKINHKSENKFTLFMQKWGFLVVIFLSFAVYLTTFNRVNSGYADSDEILTVGKLLGVAHPPGYILSVLLVYLSSLLPFSALVAFKANLINAFSQSIVVALVYQTIVLILQEISPKKGYKFIIYLSAFTASLVLAFTTEFWIYANNIEVMGMNNLLAALSVYLAFAWRKQIINSVSKSITPKEWKLFLATGFVAGLGIVHLQTYLVLLPAFLVLLFFTLKDTQKLSNYFPSKLPWLLGMIFSGVVLTGLLIFLINKRHTDFSWFMSDNLNGVVRHLLRKDYSGFYVEKGKSFGAYVGKIDINRYTTNLFLYIKFLLDHYLYVGVVIGFLGFAILSMKRKAKSLTYILGSFYGLSGLLIAIYVGYPQIATNNLEYRLTTAINLRQHIMGEVIFALLIGVGLYYIFYKIYDYRSKSSKLILSLIGLTLVLTMVILNYSKANQSQNTYAYDYANNVLSEVEPDSLIVCMSDFSCFSLVYLRYAENVRPDVAVITKNPKYQRYFLDANPQYHVADYKNNPYFTEDVIAASLGKRHVYLTDLQDFYVKKIGLEGNPFYVIPKQYSFELVTKIPDKIDKYDYQFTKNFLAQKKPKDDLWLSGMSDYFSNLHNLLGVVYSYLNEKDAARQNFELAIALNDYSKSKKYLADLIAYDGNPLFALGSESSSSAQLLTRVDKLTNAKKYDEAHLLLRKILILDPYNREARAKVINLLQLGGYYSQARDEIKNYLKLFPNDQKMMELREKIKSLSNKLPAK